MLNKKYYFIIGIFLMIFLLLLIHFVKLTNDKFPSQTNHPILNLSMDAIPELTNKDKQMPNEILNNKNLSSSESKTHHTENSMIKNKHTKEQVQNNLKKKKSSSDLLKSYALQKEQIVAQLMSKGIPIYKNSQLLSLEKQKYLYIKH